jgi:serine/threonine protein kinase
MALNWNNYDEYFNHPRDQQQIDENTKLEIERIAAEILGLDDETLKSNWGSCSPPGVFAQTVVRVESSTPHRFSGICQKKAIGLKIFKKGKGRKLVFGHKHLRNKLPGLPNDFVQEVYDAGEHNDTFYLVQEWVEGNSLENFLASQTHTTPEVAKQLLSDLVEGILLPLWSAGTIWWDIRAGNFCVTERDGKQRLVLIDTDSLLAYAEEIIETPQVFTKRNHGKVTALKRIKTIATDLVMSAISEEKLKGKRSSIEKQIRANADASLIVFDQPGRLENGQQSFETLIERLQKEVYHPLEQGNQGSFKNTLPKN